MGLDNFKKSLLSSLLLSLVFFVIGVSSSQVDLVIVCSASCCIVVHNDGNGNVVDVVIHEHCVLTMLLNSDLSHEVNLAKKEKKRKLKEWEVNEIFEDN
jgi:hypothetical protein